MVPIRLRWEKRGSAWVARSHAGTPARIYPHSSGRKDTFVVEADLGSKTYCAGADASEVIARSSAPAATRRQILDSFKRDTQGYIMRFDTTGIEDPEAANAAIVKMDSREWHRRINDWWAKNPTVSRRGTKPSKIEVVSAGVTETRAVALRFHVDTNQLNARQKLPAMNRLDQWHDNDVIELLMSEPAAAEARRGGAPNRHQRVNSFVHTMTLADTEDEERWLKLIQQAAFPKGFRKDSERRDVEILFNVKKYGGYLVTNDGASKGQPEGILGARAKLADLGIRVVTAEGACRLVEERIRARDERARYEANETGAALPPWVGCD